MFDDLFSATVTVDAADADRASMRARAYRVKRQKNGKARVTAWFTTEAAATAWEAEFADITDLPTQTNEIKPSELNISELAR
jgi:hypothetical protein